MFGLDVDTLRRIRGVLSEFPAIDKVLIYGSRAMATYRPGSDIDITLIGTGLTLNQCVYPLANKLDDLYLPYTFDISIFKQLDDIEFIAHILRRGQLFYRKERVGLPAGWEVKRLGEVCEKGSSNVSMKSIINNEGKYPIYGAKGFIKNVDFYHHDKQYITIIKDGAGIGRTSIRAPLSSVIATLQYIFPKANVDITYLYYALSQIEFSKYVHGAAIPHIYFKDYSLEKITLPPLAEQKRIAAKLDAIFAHIDTLKRNTEKNLASTHELFTSYMHQLFAAGKKAGWAVKRLGEVCEFVRGITYSKKDEVQRDGLKVLRANNIDLNSSLNLEDIKIISAKLDFDNNKKLRMNDIFICLASGSKTHIGKVAFIENDTDFYFGAFMGSVRVTTKNKAMPQYIFQQLKSLYFNEFLNTEVNGVNINNLSFRILEKYPLSIPPFAEQKQIASKLDILQAKTNELKEIYQRKLTLLDELRRSILERAFVGEV